MNSNYSYSSNTIPSKIEQFEFLESDDNKCSIEAGVDSQRSHDTQKHNRSINEKNDKIKSLDSEVTDTFYDEQYIVHDDEDGVSIETDIGKGDGRDEESEDLIPLSQILNTPSSSAKVKSLESASTSSNNNERVEFSIPNIRKEWPQELAKIFQCVDEYTPDQIKIEAKLKCFIPPYIPSIGKVDPFIKVPRPDNVDDGLGLYALDEPATEQSDAAVLELQLRTQMKKKMNRHGGGGIMSQEVQCIENASKNQFEIDKWIESVENLRRSRPVEREVTYKEAHKMPPFDDMMTNPFPKELQHELNIMVDTFEQGNVGEKDALLDPKIDLTLEEYARTICVIMDVPISEGYLIQSLDYLFNVHIQYQKDFDDLSML